MNRGLEDRSLGNKIPLPVPATPPLSRQRLGKAVLQNNAEHLFQPQLRRLAATRKDRQTQLPPRVSRWRLPVLAKARRLPLKELV